VGLIGWYLAGDLGRAAYHFLTRGLAPTVIGLLLFDIRLATPLHAVAFLISIPLAVTVSFALRFLVASTAFWLLDATGPRTLSGAVALFFSGMVLPLVLYPGWLGTLARSLPWSAIIQVPNDLWLGKYAGWQLLGALGFQALWALVLLGCCQLVLGAATRKVVLQGG
jgi:ABC-2 type transport system permease protein